VIQPIQNLKFITNLTMSYFGTTLFSGSPFIRWILSPVLLLMMIWMPIGMLTMTELNTTRVVILIGVELLALLLLIGFWSPPALALIAFRGVCFLVFLAYLAYVISEFRSDKPLTLPQHKGEASPIRSLFGFVMIGLPALGFAIFGRFTRRPPPTETREDQDDEPM